MVHNTPARREARILRDQAHALSKEAHTLASMEGLEAEATVRHDRAKELNDEARELQDKARLEDLTVREEALVKQTKKGERTYYRWVASWRNGDKIRHVYLGSCRKMGQAEALEKARRLKAKALEFVRDDISKND